MEQKQLRRLEEKGISYIQKSKNQGETTQPFSRPKAFFPGASDKQIPK